MTSEPFVFNKTERLFYADFPTASPCLHIYGLHWHGLCSYGVYSYGLYSYGQFHANFPTASPCACGYCLRGHGPYSDVVMAYIVMACSMLTDRPTDWLAASRRVGLH